MVCEFIVGNKLNAFTILISGVVDDFLIIMSLVYFIQENYLCFYLWNNSLNLTRDKYRWSWTLEDGN